MGWRVNPLAVAIDSGEMVDGTDDGVSSYTDVLRALDDVAEGEAEVAVALVVEVDRPRVPIEGVRRNLIGFGDIANTMPVNELFFDGFAERTPADQAEAFVVSDWDANAFLHEGEFFIWSQGTFASRTLLVFFLGLRRGRVGHGLRGWFGDGCGRCAASSAGGWAPSGPGGAGSYFRTSSTRTCGCGWLGCSGAGGGGSGWVRSGLVSGACREEYVGPALAKRLGSGILPGTK